MSAPTPVWSCVAEASGYYRRFTVEADDIVEAVTEASAIVDRREGEVLVLVGDDDFVDNIWKE